MCLEAQSSLCGEKFGQRNDYVKREKKSITSVVDSICYCCCSVSKSCPTLQPHGLQHARLPWPPVSPWICSDSCPLSCWCYLTISCSAGPFSSCLQSFPASDSFPVSHLFASGGQNIRTLASTSALAVTIQGWFPFRLTGLISLLSKGLSRVFSSTIIWNNQFFSTQPLYGPTLTSIRD